MALNNESLLHKNIEREKSMATKTTATSKFKFTNIPISYLEKIWKYDICDFNGKHNLMLNVFDALFYLAYFTITLFVLWTVGIKTLSFYATIILIIRQMLKYLKKNNDIGNRVAIVFFVRLVAFGMITVFLTVIYIFVPNEEVTKVLLTLYYIFFALIEITDIMADCFEATPHLYQ